mgnify:CR=1 FL=1|jgi:hypothetical protein
MSKTLTIIGQVFDEFGNLEHFHRTIYYDKITMVKVDPLKVRYYFSFKLIYRYCDLIEKMPFIVIDLINLSINMKAFLHRYLKMSKFIMNCEYNAKQQHIQPSITLFDELPQYISEYNPQSYLIEDNIIMTEKTIDNDISEDPLTCQE